MSVLDIISFIKQKFALEYYPLNSEFFGIEYQPTNSVDDYPVRKVLITLTLSNQSLLFALKKKINLIITYLGLLNKFTSHFDPFLINKLNLLSKSSSLIYSLNSSILASEYGTSATLRDILFLKTENIFKINIKSNKIPIGRICLPKKYPISNNSFLLENLIKRVKNKLEMDTVQYAGDLKQKVVRICIIAGDISNMEIIRRIIELRCDCLIGCNVSSKQFILGRERDLCIINIPFLKILYLTLKKFHKILSLEFPNKKIFFFESNYPIKNY